YWILAAGRRRIRIATVGAHEPVDHKLERRGRLIPVDRADDHDPVRRDPFRIDFIHPIPGLANRMIWIAGAWPVTKRLSSGDTGFAGENLTAVFGRQTREVEHLAFEVGHSRHNLACNA